MEEVDGILITALKQAQCSIPDSISSVEDFDTNLIYKACVACINKIDPSQAQNISFSLPKSMSDRYKASNNLCSIIQQLGFVGKLSYHQLLYPNSKDTRQILSFLIQQLPKTEDNSLRSLESKREGINGRIASGLKAERSKSWIVPQIEILKESQFGYPSTFSSHPITAFYTPNNDAQRKYASQYLPRLDQQTSNLSKLHMCIAEDNARRMGAEMSWEEEWTSAIAGEENARREYVRKKASDVSQRMASILERVGRQRDRSEVKQMDHIIDSLRSDKTKTESQFSRGREFGQHHEDEARQVIGLKKGKKNKKEKEKQKEDIGEELEKTKEEQNQSEEEEKEEETENQEDEEEEEEDPIIIERNRELEELQQKLGQINSEMSNLSNETETLKSTLRQLKDSVQTAEKQRIELEDEYQIKKKSVELLEEREANMKELGNLTAQAAQDLMELGEQWEEHRKPLIEEYRERKEQISSRKKRYREMLEQIREMRSEMRDLVSQVRNKDENLKSLQEEYDKLPKDTDRAYYVRRIMDIIKNIKKQQTEIKKILADNRQVQRQINTVSDSVDRSFRITEDRIFKDASKDETLVEVYRKCTELHRTFEKLIQMTEEKGAATTETLDLEVQIDLVSARNDNLNSERVLSDLEEVKKENAKLDKYIRSMA